MFKIHEIRELIKMVDQSGVHELSFEHEGSKLTLKKEPVGQIVTATPMPQVQHAAPVSLPEKQVTAVPQEEKSTSETVAPKKEIDKNLHQIKSPMVGTFYRASSPDADSYVNVGDDVTDNTVVCIVEAMKLFNEIEAEVKGEIVEILVENGQLVEYGQPLFLVKAK